jgi:predicted XRE-type DNA-binding protein
MSKLDTHLEELAGLQAEFLETMAEAEELAQTRNDLIVRDIELYGISRAAIARALGISRQRVSDLYAKGKDGAA